MWLEIFHLGVHGVCKYLFVFAFSNELQGDEKAAKHCNCTMYSLLYKILKDFNADMVNDNAEDNDEKVGTHSIQKFAYT